MTRALLVLVALGFARASEAAIPEIDAASATVEAAEPATPIVDRLRARRAAGIAFLEAYAEAGVFPVAPAVPGLHHQFIDPYGRRCAVAAMIENSGHGDLVRATAAVDNDVVLAELTDGPLVAWMLGSGFTREEIAVIQVPGWKPSAPVRPVAAPKPENPAGEVKRIRQHLRDVLKLLVDDTEISLIKAAERYAALDGAS